MCKPCMPALQDSARFNDNVANDKTIRVPFTMSCLGLWRIEPEKKPKP